MTHFISPARGDLLSLRTPLTRGERQVLDLFDKHLPPGWEIYTQPHLNGLRPDFVLLHPRVGIAVFDVEDWDIVSYFVERSGDTRARLYANTDSGPVPVDDPVSKAVLYRNEILDLYCPRHHQTFDETRGGAVVSAGVIMTAASTAEVRRLLDPLREAHKLLGSFEPYNPLVGREAVASGNLRAIFPDAYRTESQWMSDELYRDLRLWLVEPAHSQVQRRPLQLDDHQKDLAETRTRSGYRRIKGPAGAGKSLVLAWRAMALASDGRDVLVVSFNITLLHWLRDLAVRYPNARNLANQHITWLNFHEWCKRMCHQAGLQADLSRIWSHARAEGGDQHGAVDRVLERELPQLVESALASGGKVPTYDAVLVDEGQDFNLEWWNLLRKVCNPDGEMVLVADEAQDIYRRTSAWTEDSLSGAGFRGGRWSKLPESHRLPPALASHVREFVQTYLPDSIADAPPRQTEMGVEPLDLCWVQVSRGSAANACVNAVLQMPVLGERAELPYADVTLLVPSKEIGQRCVQEIEAHGVRTDHTFAKTPREERRKKLAFWMGDARVKVTTVHSFKGWESRAIVLYVDDARPASLRVVYVGLSRLRRWASGSYLTVICSAPELAEYGRTWPKFDLRSA